MLLGSSKNELLLMLLGLLLLVLLQLTLLLLFPVVAQCFETMQATIWTSPV